MHCWKSFNVDSNYHFYRLFFISTMITLLVFIMIFVLVQPVANVPFQDNYFFPFLTIFILLYPIHKLFHFLPLAKFNKDLKLEIDFHFYILPIINIKVKSPIPKQRYGTALLLPFTVINILLFACIFIFPQYIHYITILLAYHIGLCTVDLIHYKSLYFSPKDALIEENEQGFEILVKD